MKTNKIDLPKEYRKDYRAWLAWKRERVKGNK